MGSNRTSTIAFEPQLWLGDYPTSRRVVGLILKSDRVALLLKDSGEWVNTWGLGLKPQTCATWHELIPGHVFLDPGYFESDLHGTLVRKAQELCVAAAGH